MSVNATNMYDIDAHIAEFYDRTETYSDDVELIRRLIGERGPLRILEPFCGTGRILIPLALDGHDLYGLDQAHGMLARAREKTSRLPQEVRNRITLAHADVVTEPWPHGLDLVILGGNCLYELATPEEQEHCIIAAAASLDHPGYVYVDNDHMEGDLDPSWQKPGVFQSFPTGTCADGTRLESTSETTWYDTAHRLVRIHRWTKVTFPDGTSIEKAYTQQKHPVSKAEVQAWLQSHGLVIEQVFGDRAGSTYREDSPRAIFWARLD